LKLFSQFADAQSMMQRFSNKVARFRCLTSSVRTRFQMFLLTN